MAVSVPEKYPDRITKFGNAQPKPYCVAIRSFYSDRLLQINAARKLKLLNGCTKVSSECRNSQWPVSLTCQLPTVPSHRIFASEGRRSRSLYAEGRDSINMSQSRSASLHNRSVTLLTVISAGLLIRLFITQVDTIITTRACICALTSVFERRRQSVNNSCGWALSLG